MSQRKWDPHASIICPYDPLHVITAQRFQRHIHKCRKNYPEKDLVQCSFNANHFVLRKDICQHLISCPDKPPVENNIIKLAIPNSQKLQSFCGNLSMPKSKQIVSCAGEEDWDEEIDSTQTCYSLQILNKISTQENLTQTWLDSSQTQLNWTQKQSESQLNKDVMSHQLVTDREVTLLNSQLRYSLECLTMDDLQTKEKSDGCLYEKNSYLHNLKTVEKKNDMNPLEKKVALLGKENDILYKRSSDINNSNGMQTSDFFHYKKPSPIEHMTRDEINNIYQRPFSIDSSRKYDSKLIMENFYSYQDSRKKSESDCSAQTKESFFSSSSKHVSNPNSTIVVQSSSKVTQTVTKPGELTDSKHFSIGRGALKKAIFNYNSCKT
ncbi:uncharacterized protein LOC101241717 isoform X1 [Hydra vulgaris]|uniref:uncharacterized protein LOC101241717 isoform X1 n=1 Tax=Hydra vulgaris TaxID=6087 RepID=UPI001F5E4B48|nr:uncharacterized protein LOC101241717 [Hydra vulgaris]